MAQIPYMNWMGDQPTGSAYDVYQYYLGGGSPGGTTPTSGGGGVTSLPWYLQTGGGDGGDNYFGPNAITKDFNKNVWTEKGGPRNMYGGWKKQDVTGYYTPSGWKTKEGKNIEHGGLFKTDLNRKTGDIKGIPFKEAWEDEKEKLAALRAKIFGSKSKVKKEKELKKHQAAIIEKERRDQKDQKVTPPKFPPSTWTPAGDNGGGQTPGQRATEAAQRDDPGLGGHKKGGMITDLTKDPEYRGWKKMYETNPEIGSMHEKHPTFIKFYKKHERDKKQFGGLAGLLYG